LTKLKTKNKRLPPILVKVVVLGNLGVGKTSLVSRFYTGAFSPDHIPTVFRNYSQTVFHGDKEIELSVWDTEMWDTSFSIRNMAQRSILDPEGGEDYSGMRKLTYNNTDVFLFCFALNDRESFEYVKHQWYKDVTTSAPVTPYVTVLCGTKADLKQERAVTSEEAIKTANELNCCAYVECSAAKGENVYETIALCLDAAFEHLVIVELTPQPQFIAHEGRATFQYRVEKRPPASDEVVERGLSIDSKYKYPRARDDHGRGGPSLDYFQRLHDGAHKTPERMAVKCVE